MATVAPTGNGDQVAAPRNGGTILHGGNLSADSPMTRNIVISELADDFGQAYGSKVIAKAGGDIYTDRVGISGAVPGNIVAGTTELGYKADGTEWVVVGGNVTRTLAGSAYTGLIGGAEGPDSTRDSTYELETTRLLGVVDVDTLAAPASGYNSFVTKSNGPGGAGGTVSNFINPAVAGGATASADSAANSTLAVPGELTYMFGGKLPQNDDYKARNVRES